MPYSPHNSVSDKIPADFGLRIPSFYRQLPRQSCHPSVVQSHLRMKLQNPCALVLVSCWCGLFMSCAGLPSSQPTQPPPPPSKFQLTVSIPTANSGTVTSTPAGINCPSTCAVKFKQNTKVTLTASAANDYSFSGWGGGTCSGTNPCEVTLTANTSVSATFTKNPATITSLNHIIFLAQENRSFDEYFGYMRQYWANNGISDQQFDGLAQFTPASQCTTSNGVSSCAPPTNPPCSSSTGSCVPDPNGKAVPSFHILSECTEDKIGRAHV